MRTLYSNFKVVLLFMLIFFSGCAAGFKNFITTEKDKLKDGGKELRFISYNIPNLHYIEDYWKFNSVNQWKLPDEFEIRDALRTIRQSGGKVTRMYVLSVRKEGDSENIIRHVEAPAKFNEDAFKALDKVFQIANEEGVRLILPLVDNWWWWGGPKEYAAFRGKKKEEFWTDSLLISDFKRTVEFIVNRRNTYTGELYKDDKALLGWETGNELECPANWNSEIAAYIKSLDKNHLVIAGTHIQILNDELINDPNIDILSTHHYSPIKPTIEKILTNKNLTRDKKPYFVGEFGFIPTKDIEAILDTVINNNVAGIMIWSMRGRNSEGGFYYHSSDRGGGAYRYPGFESGIHYDEKNVVNLFTLKAYQINKEEIPPVDIPGTPILNDFYDVNYISWKGYSNAVSYDIERKEETGNWIKLTADVNEDHISYRPLFADTSAEIGKSYSYRVISRNEAGVSDYSNEVGPINVSYKKIIDEIADTSKMLMKQGTIEFLTYKDIVKAKEDRNRIAIPDSAFIIYTFPDDINEIRIDGFEVTDSSSVEILTGQKMNELFPVVQKLNKFVQYKNDYGIYTAVTYSADDIPAGNRFIKIILRNHIQVGRIEITYAKRQLTTN